MPWVEFFGGDSPFYNNINSSSLLEFIIATMLIFCPLLALLSFNLKVN